MSDIEWTIKPEDIEWEMTWEPRDLHPDKPPKERVFEADGALAHLLTNSVCFLSNYWIEREWPAEAQTAINVLVICSDTFAYACADCERLPYDQIEPLYRLWRKDPRWGPTAWAVTRRKERPIPPVVRGLTDAGYDVEALLRAELPRIEPTVAPSGEEARG